MDGRAASRSSRLLLPLAAALLAAPESAFADVLGENGSVFASVAMLSDDNFYRLSSNPQRESRVRVAAGLSTGLELGQQQLTIAGRVHDNRFENASELDYVGGGAELRLDWRVGSRLDGVLAHNYVRELTSFDRVRPGRVLRRDITTIAESRASVGYFLLPRLQVRAEAASVDWAHSAPTWRASELEERQYAVDLMYRTRPGTFIGIGARRHDGRYPHRIDRPELGIDSVYEQTNVALLAEWHPGGKTSIDARIGHTSRERSLSIRDFDAVTGEFALELAMTTKTAVTLRYSRDIYSVDEADARGALVETFELSPVWRASRRTTLSFHAFYRHQDFLSVPGREGMDRVDDSLSLETQMYYRLRGRFDLELGVGRGRRESTWADLGYDYWYGSLGVRVTL